MVQVLVDIIKSARPRQALKNLSLFAPLVFSGRLFDTSSFFTVLWCAFIFSILSSSVYIINDIVDMPRDQLHPFKKNRPIASGRLPLPVALFLAITGITIAFLLSSSLNFFFFLTVLSYFILQMFYIFSFKNIIVLDVMAISLGFILRVYAGAIAINIHTDVWFLLCVVSLALFLSVGKRRAELAILTEQTAAKHRQTLTFYTPDLLDSYLSMFANAAWMSYALFTFFSPPPAIQHVLPFMTKLPLTLAGTNKWLMITIPLVIYGIMRYMSIIYQGSRAESPERVLLSDRPLLYAVAIGGIMVIAIIYGLRP